MVIDLDELRKEFSDMGIPNNKMVTRIPDLIHEIEALREVARAAEDAMDTVAHVYSGTPGKLDWPAYHKLRQALEKLRGEK